MRAAVMQFMGVLAPHCASYFTVDRNTWVFLGRLAHMLGAGGTKPSTALLAAGRRLLELVYNSAPSAVCTQLGLLPLNQSSLLKTLLLGIAPNIDSLVSEAGSRRSAPTGGTGNGSGSPSPSKSARIIASSREDNDRVDSLVAATAGLALDANGELGLPSPPSAYERTRHTPEGLAPPTSRMSTSSAGNTGKGNAAASPQKNNEQALTVATSSATAAAVYEKDKYIRDGSPAQAPSNPYETSSVHDELGPSHRASTPDIQAHRIGPRTLSSPAVSTFAKHPTARHTSNNVNASTAGVGSNKHSPSAGHSPVTDGTPGSSASKPLQPPRDIVWVLHALSPATRRADRYAYKSLY